MTDMMNNDDLVVSNVNGELVVDSDVVATRLGVTHKALKELIRKTFESEQVSNAVSNGVKKCERKVEGTNRPETYYLLNERQLLMLITRVKGTDQANELKDKLVDDYLRAKEDNKRKDKAIAERDAYIAKLEHNLSVANRIVTLSFKSNENTIAHLGYLPSTNEKELQQAYREYFKYNDEQLKLNGCSGGANKHEYKFRYSNMVRSGRERFVENYCQVLDVSNFANVEKVLDIWERLDAHYNGINPDDLKEMWCDAEKWDEALAAIGYNDERDDYDYGDDEPDCI